MEKGGDALESSLSLLKSLAFAGNLNAVAPGDDLSKIPQTEGVPGSEVAKDWFKGKYEGVEASPSILILVGGPGNGKSLLISNLVNNPNYEPLEVAVSGFAPRSARYKYEGRILHAVNDATIGLNALQDAESLIEDIDISIEKNEWLVVAVNRGVLVEELAGRKSRTNSAAVEIIKWLNTKQSQKGNHAEEYKFLKKPDFQDSTQDYIDSIRIKELGVDVLAVHMDTCSLCEELPNVEIDGNEGSLVLNAEPYKVKHFIYRDDAESANKTPGGALLKQIFSLEDPEGMFYSIADREDEVWNPIYANITSLSNEEMRTGLLSILRASEVVEGSRYTWRTFWGSVAYATVGYLFEPTERPPMKWVSDHKPSIAETPEEITDDTKAVEQLQAMIKLSEIRTHQAIFGVGSFNLKGEPFEERSFFKESPVQKISKVDPILDAVKGDIGDWDLDEGFDPDSLGWASAIDDAFNGIESGESPISKLKEKASGSFFATKFDEMLDECVCRVVKIRDSQVLSDNAKNNLFIWYGRYLTRLYALSNGLPAYLIPIDKWTLIWNDAFDDDGTVDRDDADKLSQLLFPQYEDGYLFLPYFESRAIPLVDRRDEDLLALKVDIRDLAWKWKLFGDSIRVRPTSRDLPEELSMSLDVDFSFVREMEACASNSRGITELSLSAEPVVERFRSSLLSRTVENSQVVVLPADGSDEIRLTPRAQGRKKGDVDG